MEALVNTVLLAAHPSLRERCNAAKVVSVLEELGAYDSSALRSLLSSFTDTVAHKLKEEDGWYVGTVQHFGVGSSWRQPDATHIVMYSQKETGTKHLAGRVACKLAADNYGASEWWLLLEPAPES